MALAPQFATHRIGSPTAAHTLELYLDLICPYSQKQLAGVRTSLIPLLQSNPEVGKALQIIIRQTPQPWHPSSPIVHEAALAASRAGADGSVFLPHIFEFVPGSIRALTGGAVNAYSDPTVINKFQEFFFALMDGQKAFYDEPTSTQSPNQTREQLAELGASVGIDKKKMLEAFKVGKSNGGTPVTNDLKLAIKYGRQNGVHVTPTVALDGLIDGSISSSFTKEDWEKYLEERIGVKV